MSATLGKDEAKELAVQVMVDYVQNQILDADAAELVFLHRATEELSQDDQVIVAEYVNTARCLITASWED